jgi:hypothetical protein
VILRCVTCGYSQSSVMCTDMACPKCGAGLEGLCRRCGLPFKADVTGECPNCHHDWRSELVEVRPATMSPGQARVTAPRHSPVQELSEAPRKQSNQYKVVPFGKGGCGEPDDAWNAKTVTRYESMLNSEAASGWRFVHFEAIPVKAGCWLFQSQSWVYLVTFERNG